MTLPSRFSQRGSRTISGRLEPHHNHPLETQFSLTPPVGLHPAGTHAGVCCCPISKTKLIIWIFMHREPTFMHNCSVMSNSCDPMDYRLPGFSFQGIFQARILEWAAISSSRGSSPPSD